MGGGEEDALPPLEGGGDADLHKISILEPVRSG